MPIRVMMDRLCWFVALDDNRKVTLLLLFCVDSQETCHTLKKLHNHSRHEQIVSAHLYCRHELSCICCRAKV